MPFNSVFNSAFKSVEIGRGRESNAMHSPRRPGVQAGGPVTRCSSGVADIRQAEAWQVAKLRQANGWSPGKTGHRWGSAQIGRFEPSTRTKTGPWGLALQLYPFWPAGPRNHGQGHEGAMLIPTHVPLMALCV